MPGIDALTPRLFRRDVTWRTTRGEVRAEEIRVGYFRRSTQRQRVSSCLLVPRQRLALVRITKMGQISGQAGGHPANVG